MANETESCQPDMPITTDSRLVLSKQRLTASERKWSLRRGEERVTSLTTSAWEASLKCNFNECCSFVFMIYSLQWRKSRVVPHNNNKLSYNLVYWIIWESYLFIKHVFWIFLQYLFSVCNKRNRIIILIIKFMKANVINYWFKTFLMWYQWLFVIVMTGINSYKFQVILRNS